MQVICIIKLHYELGYFSCVQGKMNLTDFLLVPFINLIPIECILFEFGLELLLLKGKKENV